jgi:hypothetical protein
MLGMKVMVATARTQGQRDNDFFWCVEGELVWFGQMCARGRADPDANCGCGRGFAGMSSHRSTTTAEVRDLDITYEEFQLALRSSLEDQGWCLDCLDHDAHVLTTIAAAYPEGAVLERRRYDIRNRWWATERS